MGLNVHVIECTIDPNVPPDHVGQHWINTTNGCQWLAHGTSVVGDWRKLEGDTDEKAGVTSSDSNPSYLDDEIVVGPGLKKTVVGAPATDQTLKLELAVVDTFANLPGSPVANETVVFYKPFNANVMWDGADWVGPKFIWQPFGRRGQGDFAVWLDSVGRAEVSPLGGVDNAVQLPEIAPGSALKLYNIAAKSDVNVTGDLEIHKNATTVFPVFGTTGIGLTSFTNNQKSDTELGTPGILDPGDDMQCYLRRTAGTWNDLSVTLVVALVARA